MAMKSSLEVQAQNHETSLRHFAPNYFSTYEIQMATESVNSYAIIYLYFMTTDGKSRM
jgi:hypothetical protein